MKGSIFGYWFFALLLVGCGSVETETQEPPSSDVVTQEEQQAMTPDQVLADLKAGNERFAGANLTARDFTAQAKSTATGQYPKAAVLACVDSRVPVEIVLDQGIGDIFVGRVAGNIEDDIMIGSLEFATGVAGSKLIVVLGHSECGAVKGSIDRDLVKELGFDNLNTLLDDINLAVEASLDPGEDRSVENKDLVNRAIRQNVVLTIERLREKSPDLRTMEEEGKIKIVGGIYDLATGVIDWL